MANTTILISTEVAKLIDKEMKHTDGRYRSRSHAAEMLIKKGLKEDGKT